MRKALTVLSILVISATAAAGAAAADRTANGLVYRYYAPYGYRFQPLLSFGRLNRLVSDHNAPAARRLAAAPPARGARRGAAPVWGYDFSFGGGPRRWRSGLTPARPAPAPGRRGGPVRHPPPRASPHPAV